MRAKVGLELPQNQTSHICIFHNAFFFWNNYYSISGKKLNKAHNIIAIHFVT